MIVALSLMSLVSGGGLACAATRNPTATTALERWGGTLFVAGLALLGADLQALH